MFMCAYVYRHERERNRFREESDSGEEKDCPCWGAIAPLEGFALLFYLLVQVVRQ